MTIKLVDAFTLLHSGQKEILFFFWTSSDPGYLTERQQWEKFDHQKLTLTSVPSVGMNSSYM